MTLFFWLLTLLVAFAALWYFLPSGWMTKVWGVLWVFVEGSGEILEFLAAADWGILLTDPQAFVVTLACGVGVIMARMRGTIQNR